MVAGSILPVALNENGELCFLFGKENPMEDSAKGYSDFGGRLEKNETPYEGALREGSEELTGFLGDKKQLRKLIKKNGGFYPLEIDSYHIHIFYLKYDEHLPLYYNKNHEFLWNKMDKKLLNNSKLFEKIKIEWFSISDMMSRKKEFRNFYQTYLNVIMEHEDKIADFLKKRDKVRVEKKTRKNRK
tara:strand:- start:104 stop:661 length:558 start_codon:yes stop_codon:yes gene_type:complete